MKEAIEYRGYVVQAIPDGSEGIWRTQVRIRCESEEGPPDQKYIAIEEWDTREKAVAASLKLGTRVIDGEIEGLTPPQKVLAPGI